jgi:hypothetical protein
MTFFVEGGDDDGDFQAASILYDIGR